MKLGLCDCICGMQSHLGNLGRIPPCDPWTLHLAFWPSEYVCNDSLCYLHRLLFLQILLISFTHQKFVLYLSQSVLGNNFLFLLQNPAAHYPRPFRCVAVSSFCGISDSSSEQGTWPSVSKLVETPRIGSISNHSVLLESLPDLRPRLSVRYKESTDSDASPI